MCHEGAEERLGALDAASVSARNRSKSVQIEDGGVGQGIDFQVAPEPFDRIKFRRIGRQEHGMVVRGGPQ